MPFETGHLLWTVSATMRSDLLHATEQDDENIDRKSGAIVVIPGVRQEEDATSRLVDTLIAARMSGWTVTVRKHRKFLEGKRSSADLRLALQLTNKRWLNLLLQAK